MSPTTAAIRPQPRQEQALRNRADILVFGGAAGGGKSWSLLLEPLKHHKRPGFNAVVFRRTHPEIMAPGGLWDQSQRIYPHVEGAVPRLGDCTWIFPAGGRLRFSHLQHATDVYAWQGSELAFIGFDELTLFEESQFWYLLSRNRTMSSMRPYIRATCNPDADSWVAKLLSWWIDPVGGFPIDDRAGVLRWFVRVNDRLEWADDPEELRRLYPDLIPKSLSFVPSKLSDNAALMAADPGYLGNLLALPLVERERLLGGNWKIRPAAGLVFNRAWFEAVRAAPSEANYVRYWDKASVPGGGDWTAGVKMARDWKTGLFYVVDVVRGQWSASERNAVVRQTAAQDGLGCDVWVEQEGGSGGKESAEISIRELAGFSIHAERVTGDKLSRAQGLSAQAEAKNVKLVRHESRDWIPAFLDELHAFPTGKHDDQVDAASGAFNKLILAAVQPWTNNYSPGDRSVFDRGDMPGGLDDDREQEDRDDWDSPLW